VTENAETLDSLVRRYKGNRTFVSLAEGSGGTISVSRWRSLGFADKALRAVDGLDIGVIASTLGATEDEVHAAIEASRNQPKPVRDEDAGETLTLLVMERKGKQSFDDLVHASGGKISRSRWQDYGMPGVYLRGAPDVENIRAIAQALRVPTWRVWLAVGRELELYKDPELPRLALSINPEANLLTRQQENIAVSLVDELVAAQKILGGATGSQAEDDTNVRPMRRAARKTTGTEGRGPRGGAK